MALLKTIDLNNGLTIENAYHRIDAFVGNKENIRIHIKVYINQEARNIGKSYIEEKFYDFIPSINETADNFIKQGYEFIKTLPEFENCLDA